MLNVTTLNKKCNCSRESRSYRVIWHSRAECWRWLFQTWKFWWFGLWFNRWGVWGNRVESCKIVFL